MIDKLLGAFALACCLAGWGPFFIEGYPPIMRLIIFLGMLAPWVFLFAISGRWARCVAYCRRLKSERAAWVDLGLVKK